MTSTTYTPLLFNQPRPTPEVLPDFGLGAAPAETPRVAELAGKVAQARLDYTAAKAAAVLAATAAETAETEALRLEGLAGVGEATPASAKTARATAVKLADERDEAAREATRREHGIRGLEASHEAALAEARRQWLQRAEAELKARVKVGADALVEARARHGEIRTLWQVIMRSGMASEFSSVAPMWMGEILPDELDGVGRFTDPVPTVGRYLERMREAGYLNGTPATRGRG